MADFKKGVREYDDLGHAEPVPVSDLMKEPTQSCYMPMHGVVMESSTTTNLRVVFDASATTTSVFSFHDTFLMGPSLYPHITTVVTQFRRHKLALTADFSKMFREIALYRNEYDFHRFVLREGNGVLSDFRMTRLTFGVTSSPFLATQVLRQLPEDHRKDHPLAADVINFDFDVDDCLIGADSLEAAISLREDFCNEAK